ncbi:Trypsin inhibitor [Hibiscus syriacus]|uniref:Trypsin inhibitor n=1 Tax=Hibiscus syriacus TaxID=106335 RepID=A0A6A3BK96_HIBSY|nr:Trypsin inhibitor [Hibiscus syriacus]
MLNVNIVWSNKASLLPLLRPTVAPDPVLDISGKILRTGTNYYILLVFHGRGGGLTLASSGNNTCPLDVVQEQLEVSNGLLVTFTPFNTKKGVIRVSTNQNIKFRGFDTTMVCYKWWSGRQVWS